MPGSGPSRLIQTNHENGLGWFVLDIEQILLPSWRWRVQGNNICPPTRWNSPPLPCGEGGNGEGDSGSVKLEVSYSAVAILLGAHPVQVPPETKRHEDQAYDNSRVSRELDDGAYFAQRGDHKVKNMLWSRRLKLVSPGWDVCPTPSMPEPQPPRSVMASWQRQHTLTGGATRSPWWSCWPGDTTSGGLRSCLV